MFIFFPKSLEPTHTQIYICHAFDGQLGRERKKKGAFIKRASSDELGYRKSHTTSANVDECRPCGVEVSAPMSV